MRAPISLFRRFLYALTASLGSTVLTLLALEGVFRLILPPSPVIVISDTANAPAEGPRVQRRDSKEVEVAGSPWSPRAGRGSRLT